MNGSWGRHISYISSNSPQPQTLLVSRDRPSSVLFLPLTVSEACSWRGLLPVLIGFWARSPAATCQWFRSHIHRSAPVASDRILLVSSPSPPLDYSFPSRLLLWGQMFVLLSIFSSYASPSCSGTPVQMTFDSRQVDALKHIFSRA